MQREKLSADIRRGAGVVGIAMLTVLGGPATGRAAAPAVFADQLLSISGSANQFCGSAHSNGSVVVSGSHNGVAGGVEYVQSLRASKENNLNPSQGPAATVPQPAHDIASYRLQAKATGHYFATSADLKANDLTGLVFAEKDINVSSSGITATVTLVSATGQINFSGSHLTLTPAVDGIIAYAAARNVALSGSNSSFGGSLFAPAGEVAFSGSHNVVDSGPVVGGSLKWSGSSNEVGDCCVLPKDCDDNDPCTAESCTNGTCVHTPVDGCTPACRTDADCDDHDASTTDTCVDGVCRHTDKPVEICDDGKDNDGNGLVDCADPACKSAANCDGTKQGGGKPEICGNFIDDDGNGLVDFEDPACCAHWTQMHLSRMVIRPSSKGKRDRLRLIGRFADSKPTGFDPRTQDTSVQISDANGQIFDATIAAMHFMPRGKRTVAFWGGACFANGLTDGRFINAKNGSVRFRTHGKVTPLLHAPSDLVLVTVRVGNVCSQETMTLRTANPTTLIYP